MITLFLKKDKNLNGMVKMNKKKNMHVKSSGVALQ